MKEINNFANLKKLKIGEWVLVNPIECSVKDKRKSIIIMEKEFVKVFAFGNSKKEPLIKINFKKPEFSTIWDFYSPSWKFFKLNKKEKLIYKKELILGSL